MRNEENPEALERQRVLIQSTIQVVQDHPNFQNEIYEQVRTHAEMIVESIQTHLEGMNQSIPEMRVDEFNQMVRLTLENNFILPDDGVPPNVSPNVNDDAFRADSVSETGEVEFTAPTLQAQSNAAENSGSEPTKKGPQKCKYCGKLRKGHVCTAIRLFDAWTDTSMTEKSHLPAEIQDSAPIEEQKNMEVSRKEWISCVPNQDLSSDLDLEPQKDREVAPSAKSQRQTGKERVKKKTADCSPPSEGHPREEQVNAMFFLLIVVAYKTHVTQTKMTLFFFAGKRRSRGGTASKRYGELRQRHPGSRERCRYNYSNGSFQISTHNWRN
jgi:hypothetical protein